MGVQITIRNVDERVRDELASRAAQRRMSMQEYLRAELERLACRPPMDAVLEAVRQRKARSGRRVAAGEIVKARDLDRR